MRVPPSEYSEDALVEQPAIELFRDGLGWETANVYNETFGPGGTLGRESDQDVVLTRRLRAAMEKLNPDVSREALPLAIEELSRDRSAMSAENANREVYHLLRNGVKVKVRGDDGSESVETVRLIDWRDPTNNDFFLASQLWVRGEMYRRRCDLVGFVNGIPLVFIELKATHRRLESAYRDNLRDYKATIPQLSDRSDVIVITDEAHRSQYDTFAQNMRDALPNASFIGFTGTPLMAGEERTREVFGDYVSIYTYRQSTEDGATVPLFYENRIPELQLTNASLNQDMEQLLEAAELDDEQEKKLEREFAREYHLITRDDRLERVAEDIVAHFISRGHLGKAMVVSIDKATAVRMYDKVQKYWKQHLDSLHTAMAAATDEQRPALQKKIAYMEETDMAVVVSQGQNEVADMRAKGLDIVPHRKRMVTEDLDTKFKRASDPLRIVFVCAMWMTGFDVPSCSTIYLDKPMRNHTLMQAIARANRVAKDKVNGLIVDYVGIFRDLQKALAIYAAPLPGGGTDTPIKDKAELIEYLKKVIAEAVAFCAERGVDTDAIVRTGGFQRIRLLDDAVTVLVDVRAKDAVDDSVEKIILNDELKRRYLLLAGNVAQLYKAILPDPAAGEFSPTCALLGVIAEKILSLLPPADISEVTADVGKLLDDSIDATGYVIESPEGADHLVDLSKIDFEALKAKFAAGRKRTEIERLRGLIDRKIKAMVTLNRARVNYLEKFQKLIAEYNAGSKNIEALFEELVRFMQSLNAEDRRAMSEGLSEEELALFDLLTKPDPTLSKKEEAKVKKVARGLLGTLKREKLVLAWRRPQQSRQAVRLCIEEVLDTLPRAYTPEVYQRKCDLTYQHVYDKYFGEGRSVYAAAGQAA